MTTAADRTPVTAALELAEQGYRVFPCHSPATEGCSCGSRCASPGKHPRTRRGVKDATHDPAIIERWWRQWPAANIGVATGGGLLVIDVDGPAAQTALDALTTEHDGLPISRAVRTGRDGGRHLWYRTDPALELGNSSGLLAAGVNVRAQGGYVLAPPSRHALGRAYEWEIPNAEIATLPTWVVERLGRQRRDAGNGANGHGNGANGNAMRKRLAAVGDVVLARELDTLHARSTEPGTGRGTALFAASVRIGRIVGAGGLELEVAMQGLLEAGERLGLDALELDRNIERGLGEGMTNPTTLAERPVARNGAAREEASDPDAPDDREDWSPLTIAKLPAFPLDALPPSVGLFAEAVAEETQTPPDLAALVALGVISAASIGGAIEIDCGTWTEEVALYILAVMPSGDRKSAVLRLVVAPLAMIERELRDEAAPQIRDRRTRRDALEARKNKLVRKAGELDDPSERAIVEAELADVAAQLEAIGEPIPPRLFADDATPEALSGLLAKHGQIAILAAEAALIDNLIGRYDANGSANLHLVCHAYSAEPTRVDRRGRDPELLDRPLLAITLTVQPHVLRGLIEHRTARDQGLVGRFAFSIPETHLGRRRTDASRVPHALHERWEEVVRRVAMANPLTEPTEQNSVNSVSAPQRQIKTIFLPLSPTIARRAAHRARAAAR